MLVRLEVQQAWKESVWDSHIRYYKYRTAVIIILVTLVYNVSSCQDDWTVNVQLTTSQIASRKQWL